jgi:spore germination protein KC
MKKMTVLLMLCSLMLTGCWDQKELNQVAVVIGAGVDKAGAHNYRVTAQVIKPSPPNKGSSGGSQLPTWSVSANGKTVLDAIKRLNQISPRALYWPHVQTIVFGDQMAREGIKSIITWFERDRDSRSGTYVVVTKGKAEDLLNKKIELGNVPAKAMADFLDTAALRQIAARKLKLRNLISILSTPGIDPSLDVLDPKMIRGKVETYQLTGLAVFKADQLKGYIDLPYTAGTAIAFNKFKDGIVTVPLSDKENEYLSYQVTDFKNEIKPTVNGDKVNVQMKIIMEGNLNDQTAKADVSYPEVRKQIISQVQKKVEDFILKTFHKAADMGSDIYGIGQKVRRHYPKFWNENKDQWDQKLKEITFTIEVDAHIRRSGLNYEPTPNKVK